VGQSFVTSVWTTLRALRHAVLVVLTFRPDLVSLVASMLHPQFKALTSFISCGCPIQSSGG
jgi:hypothetical protein